MLSPNQLALLHRIHRNGSLAAAGRETGITPAAISHQVARMEFEVQAQLVQRNARGAVLTTLGAALSVEGARIIDSAERAAQLREAHLGQVARQLHIGALSSTIRPVVSEALAHIRLRHPASQLRVSEVASTDGVKLVRRAELDIAVVAQYENRGEFEGVVHQELAEDPMLVAVPDDHPLAARSEPLASLEELSPMDWVSGGVGEQHRLQLELLADKASFTPSIVFETQSFEVALSMVSAGIAAALIPRTAWQRTAGVAVLQITTAPRRRLLAITHPTADEAQLVQPMIEALKDITSNITHPLPS